MWPVEHDTDDNDWRWDGEAMYATRELAVLTITRLKSRQQAAVDRWFASTFESAHARWVHERDEHLALVTAGLRSGDFAKPEPRDATSRRYVPAHLRQRWRVGEPVLVVHP